MPPSKGISQGLQHCSRRTGSEQDQTPGVGAGGRERAGHTLPFGIQVRMLGSESCRGTLLGRLSPTAAGPVTPAGRHSFFRPAFHAQPREKAAGTGLAGHGGVAAGSSTAPVLSLQHELQSTEVPPEGGTPKQDPGGQQGSVLGPAELHQAPTLESKECLSFRTPGQRHIEPALLPKDACPRAPWLRG